MSEAIKLPNVKKMFIPPMLQNGIAYGVFDIDLAAADARVVAGETQSRFLLDIFADPDADLYSFLAAEYLWLTTREKVKVDKKNPIRQQFKGVCHATNYLGKPKTIAHMNNLSVEAVLKVQKFYFNLVPELRLWHERIKHLVDNEEAVTNVWGAQSWYPDLKNPNVYNEAVAWIPQSTVAILINKGITRLVIGETNLALAKLGITDRAESCREAVYLAQKYRLNSAIKVDTPAGYVDVVGKFQTHDSCSGIYRLDDPTIVGRIISYMEVPLPYANPLLIPCGIKTSPLSYGDC